MKKLITKRDLKSVDIPLWKSEDIIKEEYKKFSEDEEYDIFLSHKFSDAEEILRLKYFLQGFGLKVYIDWLDDDDLNRNKVTYKNAKIIRKRMKCCRCLLYAFSEESKHSKWMPWELGFFDGYNGRVAIVPIVEEEKNEYDGQEYLGIYPYIVKDKEHLWVFGYSMFARFDHWIKDEVFTQKYGVEL